MLSVELIPVPEMSVETELMMRDINDRPILRAALSEKIDYIITGDKDYLECGIDKPRSITPADFLILN